MPTAVQKQNSDLDSISMDSLPTAKANIISDFSGARESNAGDDFHFLWTVRTALQLIAPESDLTGVSIEGVSGQDKGLIDDDELLLGIDLTEYYSGNTFLSAEKVIFSQLKYSTRHPSTQWTSARLCQRKSANKNDSVIRRLASIIEGYLKPSNLSEVKRKLLIRLVSNQPVSSELRDAVDEAQKIIKENSVSSTNQLLKLLSEKSKVEIQTLEKTANLKSSEFVLFISILDFSQCGASSRALFRIETLKEIGLSSQATGEDLWRLYELVKEKAGPGQDGHIIVRSDILAALGLGTDSPLFPAPSKIIIPNPSLETKDAQSVAEFILNNRGKQVVVHGPAGIGKTSTLTQLKSILPDGTEIFQYDCYGGGDYLNLGQERHRAEDCYIQLANEMAISLGTSFILRRITDPIDAGKVFTNRIRKASQLLGPNALLVVILDAADNAVIAGRELNSRSFVSDLRRMEIPDNCCIVYSTRSHRRDLVDEDLTLPGIELKGFNQEITSRYTRVYIPEAGEPLCKEVYNVSLGVPRFQSYLLSELSSDESDKDLLQSLHDLAPKVLEDVFEGMVSKAGQALSVQEEQHREEGVLTPLLNIEADKSALGSLIFLARPITIEDYASFAALDTNKAEDFCQALHPGVIIDGRTIRFRDEDFETYLRSKFTDAEQDEIGRHLAENLLAQCATNQYAATHVADYLVAGKRWSELIGLAVEGPEPAIIPDEVIKLHINVKRYASGLLACAATKNFSVASRLLVKLAEAKRTSETVFALVRQHPDLAALYGDVERLGQLYMREQEEALHSSEGAVNRSWLGAAHMRVAAMYARRAEFHDLAEQHLQSANSWLKIRHGLPEHERHNWEISDTDLASAAEAILYLDGPERAARWLLGWKPLGVVQSATLLAVRQFGPFLDETNIEIFFEEVQKGIPPTLRTWGPAYLVACLWKEGVRISSATLDKIAERLDRFLMHGWRPKFTANRFSSNSWNSFAWPAAFIEAIAVAELPAERTLRLLDALMPPRPRSGPSGPDLSGWEITLRFELLRARLKGQVLVVDDLMPEGWKEKLADQDKSQPKASPPIEGAPKKTPLDQEDLQRFRTFVGKLFPAYELWAETVVRQCTVDEIKDRAQALVAASSEWSRYEVDAFSFRPRCEIVWEAVLNCHDLNGAGRLGASNLLKLIATNADHSSKVGTIDTWLKFAELAAESLGTRNAALEILEQTGARVDAEAMPARERWDALMRCARIALPYDPELCQNFYRRGIKAAEDVDDESLPFITSLCSLARSLTGKGREEQRQQLAVCLRSITEEYRFRLSEENKTPWDEVLQAISGLDARVALTTIYHWDRVNMRTIDLSIPTVVAEAVRSDQLDPYSAVALLSFSPGDWEDRVERYGLDTRFGAVTAYYAALTGLNKQGRSGARAIDESIKEIGKRLCLDFGPESRKRIIPQFVTWADSSGISAPSLEKLRKIADFCETLPKDNGHTSDLAWDAKWEAIKAEKQTKLGELLVKAQSGDMTDFAKHLSEARAIDYENGVNEYVRALSENLLYGERATLVRELINRIPEGDGKTYVQLAKEIMAKWSINPQVLQAADESVCHLLQHKLRDVVYYFEELVSLAQTPREKLIIFYLEGVAQNIANWGSGPLFLAFRHVSQSLPEIDQWPVAGMAAQHLLTKVKTLVPPLPTVAPGMNEAVAGMLFSLCGHIDAHVRWAALHASRFLSRTAGEVFLSKFIPLTFAADAPSGFSHKDEKRDYFPWMTARVFGLILLERIADETPSKMRPHLPELKDHLFSKSFPHAQVRELARRALLRTVTTFPGDVDDRALEEIEHANRPKSCLYPRVSRYDRFSGRAAWSHGTEVTNAGKQFEFDSMDVIPYWFNPASEVFHLDTSAFVNAADEWVSQKWEMTNDDARSDWKTLERRYPSGSTMNRHGSLPRVETPSTYFSYHAMQCVMGQLIDQMPVSIDSSDYDDEPIPCPWEGWLSDFLPSGEAGWLADLRTLTPLEQELWQSPENVGQWLEERSEETFDRIRFSPSSENDGWTLTYASMSYYSDAIHGSALLVSALVIPEKAISLLRALEAAGPRNWQLPIQGWSYDDWTVHDDDFKLESLLTDRRHHEGFDHLDPRAKDVPTTSRRGIGDAFLTAMGLTQSPDYLHWSDASGLAVARQEYWSDNPQAERYHSFFTYGHRIWMKTDVLLNFLKRSGYDLIVSTLIDREYSYDYTRYRDVKQKRIGERASIHLVRQDGAIESMAGCRPARSAHPD